MTRWPTLVQFCVFILLFKLKLASKESERKDAGEVDCDDLLPGQYPCNFSL